MAKKRMFSLQIVDTDAFLDMPLSTQALYFHLSMRADDDGFIDNHKKIMKMTGCQEDDLKILLAKRFILSFESGILVIKHWRINNYIQKDRYTETVYIDEKNKLTLKDNNVYTECIQVGNTDKIRLDKVREDKVIKKCIQNVNKSYKDGDKTKLHDGTVIRRYFGKWVDDLNPSVKLNESYYPELKELN